MLAKLAWRLLTCGGKTWCEVLKTKYGVKVEDGAHLRARQRASQFWRGVLWGAELLKQGIILEVRNGERAFFWRDISLGTPLQEEAEGAVEFDQVGKRVAEFWE